MPHSENGMPTCYARMPRYTYIAKINMCVPFTYGGCGGNANKFFTKKECDEKCKE